MLVLIQSIMTYGGEGERVNLNTESRDVFLLKLSSQMALDESSLYHVVSLVRMPGLRRMK